MISDKPDYLTIEDSKTSFHQLLQKEYLNKDRVASLKKARAILLPLESYRDDIPLCFYNGTRELYKFTKTNYPDLDFDLCINPEDFKELSLHSDEFRLGYFVLESVLAPIFVTILSNYILNILSAKKKDKVELTLTLLNNRETNDGVSISYRGSPSEMETKISQKIELYTKEGKLESQKTTNVQINEKC